MTDIPNCPVPLARIAKHKEDSMAYTLALKAPDAGLEMIGGKGSSLAKLTAAGFTVPDGFTVTTDAYKASVEHNNLQEHILSLAKPAVVNGTMSFEQASKNIERLFADARFSDELVEEVGRTWGC